MTEAALWQQVNAAMLAKTLAELSYEHALFPERLGANTGTSSYQLKLTSGVCYRFSAHRGVWGRLDIDVKTLCCERRSGNNTLDAGQFFIDAAQELALNDATLGNLLHETANTLAADKQLLLARRGHRAAELAQLNDEALQCLLDGHPKAIVNKGRIGWGAADYKRYATEAAPVESLVWLAARPDICRWGLAESMSWPQLLGHSFSRKALGNSDLAALVAKGFLPLPVHPWQWQHYIQHHYAAQLASGDLRYVGEGGDGYLPQVSLRTLSNAQRPEMHHIKLPITILNTSCYRGIPGDYMACGPGLSVWMAGLCEQDDELRDRGTGIMQELAGVHIPHPLHSQISQGPYRYREMLGATWRQSPLSLCRQGERPMLMAALLQCDEQGQSIASALIALSGMTAERWLQALFSAVVVPLYHLLCAYGVGLVAHAQNLTLVLRNHLPQRVLLKDFQGDLRLLEAPYAEEAGLPEAASKVLTRLPENYLIHDLFTGHFVTVLRFLSAQLHREKVIDEPVFYRQLAVVLDQYQQRHPELAARFSSLNIFAPQIERVCINRVRLNVGYGDYAERPVPIVDGMLDNPLWTYRPQAVAPQKTASEELI